MHEQIQRPKFNKLFNHDVYKIRNIKSNQGLEWSNGLLPSSRLPKAQWLLYVFTSPSPKVMSVLRVQIKRLSGFMQSVDNKPEAKHFRDHRAKLSQGSQKAGLYGHYHYHSGIPTSRSEPIRHLFKDSIGWGNLLVERTLQLPCVSDSTSVCTENWGSNCCIHLPCASTELNGAQSLPSLERRSQNSLSTSRTQTPWRRTMCLWDTCLIMLAVSKNACWEAKEVSHETAGHCHTHPSV